MKITNTASALLLAGALVTSACATQSDTQTGTAAGTDAGMAAGQQTTGDQGAALAAQDRTFAMQAASGGMLEVQLGQLASQKAANAQVRSFGQRMVTDHSQANQRLMQVAQNKGLDLPTQMMPEHRAHLDMMAPLSGAEFDRMYMSHMIQEHNKDISSFEQQTRSGQDPDLRSFAQQTLPTLRQHRELAQSIASSVGASQQGTGE
ncbi:MAG TPA: DUF4142 domain-containing protein [Thermoanaerobaculia bacterium]|nr:DUF4142 domain-containing protein [Thermoanaerobaculia bacterium]